MISIFINSGLQFFSHMISKFLRTNLSACARRIWKTSTVSVRKSGRQQPGWWEKYSRLASHSRILPIKRHLYVYKLRLCVPFGVKAFIVKN